MKVLKKIFLVMLPIGLLLASIFIIAIKAENNITANDLDVSMEMVSETLKNSDDSYKLVLETTRKENTVVEFVTTEPAEVTHVASVEASEIKENTSGVVENKSESFGFAVEDIDATMYATGSVNVRKGADISYEKIGVLTVNQQVKVTGKTDVGWYQLDYNGESGYVSGKYLSETKVVTSTLSRTNSVSGCLIPVIMDGDVSASLVTEAQRQLGKIPVKLQKEFIADGWTFYVTTKNIGSYYFGGKYGSVKGVTRTDEKAIYVEDRSSAMDCIVHEFGHYVDVRTGIFETDNEDFNAVYEEEYATFCEIFETPSIGGKRELFGEGFEKYILCPNKLQACSPKLYQFIQKVLDNI